MSAQDERSVGARGSRYQIGVFARAPVPGHTKTRLIPALGPEGAAALHRAFIDDTLRHALDVDDCRVTLFHADPEAGAELTAFAAKAGAALRPQQGADLGVRMATALTQMLADAEAALIVGTDAPTLSAAEMGRALHALHAGASWCLGPSADGGYVFIGSRRGVILDFAGVRFGTRHALADTIGTTRRNERSPALGAPALLPPGYDIDTPEDLRLLRLHLLMRPDIAPTTRAAMRNLGHALGNW